MATQDNEVSASWSDIDLWKLIPYTAAWSVLDNVVWFPMQLIKTRIQVDTRESTRNLMSGTKNTIREVYQSKGLRGFYTGFFTSCVGSAPICIVFFSVYQGLKHYLEVLVHGPTAGNYHIDGHTFWVPFVAGGLADLTCTGISVPFDVIVQRMMVGEDRYKNQGLRALRIILQEEGLAGLYRGSLATICRDVPGSGIWWSTYELSKRIVLPLRRDSYIEGRNLRTDNDKTTLGAIRKFWYCQDRVAQIGCGLLSGLITTVAINPLDVAKTRIQVNYQGNAPHQNILREIAQIFRSEGLKAFTRGLLPKAAVYPLLSAVSSVMYEMLIMVCRKDVVDTVV